MLLVHEFEILIQVDLVNKDKKFFPQSHKEKTAKYSLLI
jgi:hypothetical protein